MEYLIAVM